MRRPGREEPLGWTRSGWSGVGCRREILSVVCSVGFGGLPRGFCGTRVHCMVLFLVLGWSLTQKMEFILRRSPVSQLPTQQSAPRDTADGTRRTHQGQRPRGQTYSWYTVGYVVFGWSLTSLTSGPGGKGPRTARLRTSKPVSTTKHSCGHDLSKAVSQLPTGTRVPRAFTWFRSSERHKQIVRACSHRVGWVGQADRARARARQAPAPASTAQA